MPPDLRIAVVLAAWCQLRRGEVRGLRRKEVDLERGLLAVEVTRTTTMSGRTIVKEPEHPADPFCFIDPLPGKRALRVIRAVNSRCVADNGEAGNFLCRNGESFGGWNLGDTQTLVCAVGCGFHIALTGIFSRRSNAWVLAFVQVATIAGVSLAITASLPDPGPAA